MSKKVLKGVSMGIMLFLMLFFALSKGETTDFLTPSSYFTEGALSWYGVLIVFVLETVFVKLYFEESYFNSAFISVCMNFLSAFLGIFALLISGLLVELVMTFSVTGTFHISHWILNLPVAAMTNALMEGALLKIAFKKKFKKSYWWLCMVNAITIVITTALYIAVMQNMIIHW